MQFEWDSEKNKRNIQKHGISFGRAVRVFLDPHLLVVLDKNETEERWDAIGFVETFLFVVYTERNNESIRIISARKATRREVNEYCKRIFR